MNCHTCSASVQTVTVKGGSAKVSKEATLTILVDGTCQQNSGTESPPGTSEVASNWIITLNWGDGTDEDRFPTSEVSSQRSHVYRRAGTFTVTAAVACGGCASPSTEGTGTGAMNVIDCGSVQKIVPHSPDPWPPNDESGLSAATQTALSCLRTAVAANGGMFRVESGFRPASYQTHLREVWDKHETVSAWPEGLCTDVKTNVKTEWDRHSPFGYRPAVRSRHSSGTAFDANWGNAQ